MPVENILQHHMKARPTQLGNVSLREPYGDDRQVFHDSQSLLVTDWAELQKDGLQVDGQHVYPIVLGLKADWSYQVS